MPKKTLEIIQEFLALCESELSSVARSAIYAMDQTAIRLDGPSYTTYEIRGKKKIGATTTGNTLTKLSAAYTCDGNGFKLPIFGIIPRVTPLRDYQPPEGVVLEYKTSATFDGPMICKYIKR